MAMSEPNIDSPGYQGYSSFVLNVFCVREDRFDQQSKDETMRIMAETMMLTNERLDARTTEGLRSAMATGDQAAVVEMGIRIYTGTRVPTKDIDEAIRMWQNVSRLRISPNAPDSAALRDAQSDAYLLLCAHYLRGYELEKTLVRIAPAVEAAAKAATLGKYKMCSWRTAIEYQMYLDPSCVKQKAKKRAKQRKDIAIRLESAEEEAAWARLRSVLSGGSALDRITQQHIANGLARTEAAEVERERSRPSAHRCSRSGCSAITASLSGFRRCTGRCTDNDQAHYCTKECQVQDWKRHRQVCRRATKKVVSIPMFNGETVDVDTRSLNTNQAEMLRQWSEMNETLPAPLQEFLRSMAVQSGAGPFTAERILQHIIEWA